MQGTDRCTYIQGYISGHVYVHGMVESLQRRCDRRTGRRVACHERGNFEPETKFSLRVAPDLLEGHYTHEW